MLGENPSVGQIRQQSSASSSSSPAAGTRNDKVKQKKPRRIRYDKEKAARKALKLYKALFRMSLKVLKIRQKKKINRHAKEQDVQKAVDACAGLVKRMIQNYGVLKAVLDIKGMASQRLVNEAAELFDEDKKGGEVRKLYDHEKLWNKAEQRNRCFDHGGKTCCLCYFSGANERVARLKKGLVTCATVDTAIEACGGIRRVLSCKQMSEKNARQRVYDMITANGTADLCLDEYVPGTANHECRVDDVQQIFPANTLKQQIGLFHALDCLNPHDIRGKMRGLMTETDVYKINKRLML